MAAVLACGPDAVLSYLSAACLWGLARSAGFGIDVTTPRSRRRRAGVRLHEVRHLPAEDRTVRAEIPVTSIARTLLDLATVLDRRRLQRAVEESERLGLLHVPTAIQRCEQSNGRRGVPALLSLLADFRPAPHTRSELEDRFLDLCREAGLPLPATNVVIAGLEVDFLWRDARLVVELDGYEFHRTRAAFERDRERDAELKLDGYEVVRLTAKRLRDHPEAVANLIGWLIARGPTPRP
jgi:Protein of unknown function (DUF559)